MAKVIVIGDGPGGLSAALFLAKLEMDVTVFGVDKTAMHDAMLYNYLGIPEITGSEFQKVARRQVAGFGADLQNPALDDFDKWPQTKAKLNALIETRHTNKYDSKGILISALDKGGNSIDLDPSDGSIWIAGKDSILHYNKEGQYLSEYKDVSSNQKWLSVIHPPNPGN